MLRSVFSACALGLSVIIAACASVERAPPPAQVIFDTDFGGDADDLGAIAMLHYYADRGDIDLRAIASWSNEVYALQSLAAVNQYYGRPKLPLGVRETDPWRTEWNYTKIIADQFPHDADAVRAAKPAVMLYRELLAGAAPNSIIIVTVGPLANIQNLLRSEPDHISDLNGAALVEAKVDRFIIMGGQWPDGITAHGPEWNFDGNMNGVTQEVLETLERPVVFSGYEVGEALRYGADLNEHPKNTPLYVGYKYFSEHAPWMKQDYAGAVLDNASFDQTAVMVAAIGGEDQYWTLSERGRLTVDENGRGTWSADETGSHQYIILKDKVEDTISQIAEAMTH